MIKDAPPQELQPRDEIAMELVPSVDISLPGTPMGSDVSNQSSSSMSTQRTVSTTAGSLSSIYPTQAQISTPSEVNIEESTVSVFFLLRWLFGVKCCISP